MLNFDWISHIDIGIAKFIVSLSFLLPLIFAMTLKKEYIYSGAKDMKLWRNLKLWIALLTCIMLILYSLF
jgi:hypothetical protein